MKKILIYAICLNMITCVAKAKDTPSAADLNLSDNNTKTYTGVHFMYLPNMEISIDNASEKSNAYGFAIAFGIDKENIRGELELKHISGWQVDDSTSIAGYIQEKETTDVSNTSIMTNFYADVSLPTTDKIEPFVMTGIGIYRGKIKGNYTESGYTVDYYNPCAGMPVSSCSSPMVYYNEYFEGEYNIKSTPILFAYQLGFGFSYKLENNFILDCMYRYFSTINKNIDIQISDNDTNATTNAKFKTSTHELLVGVRYMF